MINIPLNCLCLFLSDLGRRFLSLPLPSPWDLGRGYSAGQKFLRRHPGPFGGMGPGASYPNCGGPWDSYSSPGCPSISIFLRVYELPQKIIFGWHFLGGREALPVGRASAFSGAPTWMPLFPQSTMGGAGGSPGRSPWALVLPAGSASPYR